MSRAGVPARGRIMSRLKEALRLEIGIGFAALAILCSALRLTARENNDVVIMKNGDHITGEIKRLENGVLYVKPAYVQDDCEVDWNQVERIESTQTYRVTLTNGARYTANFEKTPAKQDGPDNVLISARGSSFVVPANEVATVREVETGFWNQQTGSINTGFSFNQGNSSTQLSFSANTEYRQERWWVHLDGSAVLDRQAEVRNSRYTTNVTYSRYFKGRWYAGTIVDFLKSDQQQLDLRSIFGEGIGRDLKRTYRTYLSAMAGAVFTGERYFPGTATDPRISNAEAILGLTFSTSRFKTTQISSQTWIYPSLSSRGRIRVSSNTNFAFQIARNLNWNFSIYENFDSQPPVNAPRNDSGVSTSLGWTF